MIKKITLLIAILIVHFGFAQTLPFDFSDPIQTMTGGDGAVVSIVQDNGNDVLQIIGNGADWDNAQINFAENLDLSDDTNNTISFRIKAVNGTGSGNHALKFENGTTGDTELTFSISGTEWTDVSLDFGAGLGSYGRMVIFTDFGGSGGGLSDTYLVDDISGAFHSTPDLPNLPFDFSSANQLMSGYEGAVVTIEQDNGNDVLQMVGSGADWDNAQINFQDNIDLSDDTNNTITFRVKPVNGTGSGNHLLKFESGPAGPTELPFNTTGTDWQDISVDFGPGLNNYGKMVIFTDAGGDGGGLSDTYLFDDIAGATHLSGPPDLPNLPFDFSSANQLMIGDGGAVVTIEQDNGNDVLQIIGATAAWDNAQITFADNVDLSDDANNTVKFRIKPVNGTGSGSHLLKFEQDTGGGNEELPFTTTGTDWQDVYVDFPADATTYGKMVIFTDAGDDNAGVSDTYWIDDIEVGANPPPSSANSVDVTTSQAWNGYVNAFNVSDDGYAFGFSYPVADLRATPTATSMTLEPNTAIWAAESTNAAWFDQNAATPTALLYIEASSYIENSGLAGSDLTFSGNVSVSDLGSGYSPVAFIKALDPNSGWATVVNNNVSISSTGDFTVSATAAELASGLVVQYGFSVTGPLADPADTSLGSVVIGAATFGIEDTDIVAISLYPNPSNSVWNFRTTNSPITSIEVYNLLGKRVVSQRFNGEDAVISTQGLTDGIYIARVTTQSGTKTVKLIKY